MFEPDQHLGHVATWPHRKLCSRPRCWPRWWRLEPGCNVARTWPQRDPNMTSSALAAFKRDQQVGHVCGHVEHSQTLSGHVPRPCSTWPETWPERDHKTSRYLYSVFVQNTKFSPFRQRISHSHRIWFLDIFCLKNTTFWINKYSTSKWKHCLPIRVIKRHQGRGQVVGA